MSFATSRADTPPDIEMPIEVPEVTKVATSNLAVEYADLLLTALLHHDSALLYGGFRDGVGVLFVRPRLGNRESTEIARFHDVGAFRAVMARFGWHYMAVQLYGGFARRTLIQRGRSYSCVIHMSNDNRKGYWLRVYAKIHAA